MNLNLTSRDILTCLKQVASFLKIKPGKLSFNEDSICTATKDNGAIKGVINIIDGYINESKSKLGGSTVEEKVIIRQWVEFAIIYASSEDINSVLNILNEAFTRKTYLLGNKLSIADIILYYILQKKMEKLTYLDQEKYINVCRWFDNIQQNSLIRQSNQIVNFNTIHLAKVVPVRH